MEASIPGCSAGICEGIARRKPVLWRFPEGALLIAAASPRVPRAASSAPRQCLPRCTAVGTALYTLLYFYTTSL